MPTAVPLDRALREADRAGRPDDALGSAVGGLVGVRVEAVARQQVHVARHHDVAPGPWRP